MTERVGEWGARDVVSLSVHGPGGVLDLLVPAQASSIDIASEYSRRAGLAVIPLLYTVLGTPLRPRSTLDESALTSGSVVVAVSPNVRTTSAGPSSGVVSGTAGGALHPHHLVTLACVATAVLAALAASYAARLDPGDDRRTTTIVVLAASALLSLVPRGPRSSYRLMCAPALAGATAFVMAWSPEPARLPTVLGVAALAAAVVAGAARAVGARAEEALRVTVGSGVLVFLVTAAGALLGVDACVVWAVLVLIAVLAARFVPLIAVDVPDHYLLDIERLAVTAWSARDRRAGGRGRIVVPRSMVAAVAASGQRMLTATAVAIAVVAVTSAGFLLRDVHAHIDLVGARALVGFAGAALLLAARSHRHLAPCLLLRLAGLGCVVAVVVELVPHVAGPDRTAVAAATVVAGAVLVAVAVALGRGWRSAWWSRRAEVVEGLCGSCAIGAAVIATGLFRLLWK